MALTGAPLPRPIATKNDAKTPSWAMAQYMRGPAQTMALTAAAIERHNITATRRALVGPHNAAAAFSATGSTGGWASNVTGSAYR